MTSSCMRILLNAKVGNDAMHCRHLAAPFAKRNRFIVATRASAGPASPLESVGMTRRSGNFPPSAWDYGRIVSSTSHAPKAVTINVEYERLKNEIRELLEATMMPLEKLELVNSLQQFGIRYHFEAEIQNALESIFVEAKKVFSNIVDMRATALLFKVLREHGYKVSQDVFKKFLSHEVDFTSFCEEHGHDINGIISLYEASFLGFEGEDILDMARLFASKHLKDLVESKMMDPKVEKQVKHMLWIPTHWRLMRVQAMWSIHFNDGETTVNPIILQFAKIDYNMVQEQHKREIIEIIKWWQNLSLKDELDFARDRIIESYIWTMGVIYQPKHVDARKYMTQAVSLLTIIDDMYDVYGSINELEQFTEAIVRWDVNTIDKLPKYMRLCFLALFNMVNESSYHILKEKDVVVAPYMKKLWVDLCQSYLVETKWYHDRHKPQLEEYMRNAIMTTGVPLAVSYSYMFTSQNISKEVLNFLQMSPNLINLSGKIFRLNNDISTSTIELKRGDVVKSIECYKHERNISEEEAQLHIKSIIMGTWKRINEERFSTPVRKDIVDFCINLCRASHCFYQKGDGYGFPAKDLVKSLLFDSL